MVLLDWVTCQLEDVAKDLIWEFVDATTVEYWQRVFPKVVVCFFEGFEHYFEGDYAYLDSAIAVTHDAQCFGIGRVAGIGPGMI
jgi:hypothetical protein